MSSKTKLAVIMVSAALTASAAGPERVTSGVTPAAKVEVQTGEIMSKSQLKKSLQGSFVRPKYAKTPQKVVSKSPSATPVIYGNVYYCDYDDGIYSITPGSDDLTEVVLDDISGEYGGYYYDGVYVSIDDSGTVTKWDTETWEQIGDEIDSEGIRSTAMAADPLTGTVYACAYSGSNLDFITVNTEDFTRESTILSGVVPTGMSALFFDNYGTLYGIDEYCYLYTVNPTDGVFTKGKQLVPWSAYDVEAVVDPVSGACFMTYYSWDFETTLYEVNLQEGTAEKLTDFEGDLWFTRLFILPPAADKSAPGAVNNLACTFSEGSLSGSISFTAPATTLGGDAGSGTLSYTISCNNESIATGTCAWGETVAKQYTAPDAGMYNISVAVTDAADKQSSPAATSLWIGNDTPVAVGNITLTRQDGVNTISWDAPAKSLHGGYMLASQITYDVTRMPDGVAVAQGISGTSVTDNVPDGNQPMAYSYSVTATFAGNTSEAVTTDEVMTGAVYYNDFRSLAKFQEFQSTSLNQNGSYWEYSSYHQAAQVSYDEDYAVSAWLSSPALTLEAGSTYALSFDVWCSNDSYNEQLSVFIDQTYNAQTLYAKTGLIHKKTVNWEKNDRKTLTAEFTPTQSGTYYITFNGCSPRDLGTLYIDNVLLAKNYVAALPQAPAVTASIVSGLDVKITVKAPSLDTDGNALSSIQKVTLSRGDQLLKVFDNPTPGSVLEYTETLSQAGSYYYNAVAYTADGFSETGSALLSAIEPSKPRQPVDIAVVETDTEGEVTISWTAPVRDIKDEPLAAGSVTFSIYIDGKTEPIAAGLTETSYTTTVAEDGKQVFASFSVSAANAAGEGARSKATTPQAYGKAAELPFTESFSNMTTQQLWSYYNPDDYSEAEWLLVASSTTPEAQPVDNDGGMLAFNADQLEDTAIATSGKIKISDSGSPILSFWYFAQNSREGKDELTVSINDGNGFKKLAQFSMRDEQLDGWVRKQIKLDDFKGKTISLRLTGTSFRTGNFMLIDRIEISNLGPDLAAYEIAVPQSVAVGAKFEVRMMVENLGAESREDYTVVLYRNSKEISRLEGEIIPSNMARTFVVEQTAEAAWGESVSYYFDVVTTNDEKPENNKSQIVSVALEQNDFPTVSKFSAFYTDQTLKAVELNWDAPSFDGRDGKPYTETFEAFESFAVDPDCDWTFVDGDGSIVYGPSSTTIPDANTPKAFQVIDAENLPTTYAAYSGYKSMGAFSANGQSDDWMISPMLTGSAQTVTLMARSFSSIYGLNSFEILASSTGCEVADFTVVKSVEGAPTEWTKYSADLPEGTKYFAIHHNSNDKFIIFFDDITYSPAKDPVASFEILGYNIYRNGVKINATSIDDVTYTDNALPATDEQITYAMTVVYDHGESQLSRSIAPQLNGLDSVTVAPDDMVSVYGIDGRVIATDIKGAQLHELPAGVYIIKTSDKTFKLIK